VVASLASGRARGYNLKLDEGGIMDVEFVVQALQLLHGAAHASLQTSSTWAALEALEAEGLLPPPQAEALREGYTTLRRLESRLRMLEGKGESALPLDDAEALRVLARRAGYRGVSAGEALLQDLARVRGEVRGVYRQVFGVV
jgi:glutamate-ammonia-ligase adenylyltransferase